MVLLTSNSAVDSLASAREFMGVGLATSAGIFIFTRNMIPEAIYALA